MAKMKLIEAILSIIAALVTVVKAVLKLLEHLGKSKPKAA